jgi:hypothetical protein
MSNQFINNISKKIDEKHDKFLNSVGEIPYKVSADYQLLLTEVTSKITLISTILKNKSVISDIKSLEYGEYNKITLSKTGLDFKVEILTNGTSILMKSANGMLDGDTIFMSRQWYHPTKDGWDWEDFAEQLIDFIHYTMYKLQKSEEVNFDALMRGII